MRCISEDYYINDDIHAYYPDTVKCDDNFV